MINYSDYDFYVDEYKGTLSEVSFNSLIVKASREIDKNVNRQITEDDLTNEKQNFGYFINYTACQLVDYLNEETKSNKLVSSISIDGVNKTMKSLSEIKSEKQKIFDNLPNELTRFL